MKIILESGNTDGEPLTWSTRIHTVEFLFSTVMVDDTPGDGDEEINLRVEEKWNDMGDPRDANSSWEFYGDDLDDAAWLADHVGLFTNELLDICTVIIMEGSLEVDELKKQIEDAIERRIKYVATIQFVDENMPNIHMDATSEVGAIHNLSGLMVKYAGIKCGFVTHPDGSKDFYSTSGKYLFTVPVILT